MDKDGAMLNLRNCNQLFLIIYNPRLTSQNS